MYRNYKHSKQTKYAIIVYDRRLLIYNQKKADIYNNTSMTPQEKDEAIRTLANDLKI